MVLIRREVTTPPQSKESTPTKEKRGSQRPRSKETTPIKEKEGGPGCSGPLLTRSKFLKDSKLLSAYSYDLCTFTFNKRPKLNERFDQHLQTIKINKSILFGMFIYNCIGLTTVMIKDIYLSTDLYDGLYGVFGQIFLFTVLLVHAMFFTLYYLESWDTGKCCIQPTIHPSLDPSIHPSIHPSTHPPTHPPTH